MNRRGFLVGQMEQTVTDAVRAAVAANERKLAMQAYARLKTTSVYDQKSAFAAYWHAVTPREEQAAYHEILLFGGVDGYPAYGPWRTTVVRWLRLLALWLGGPV